MKALGAVVLLVVLVAGIGFYRGWFSLAANNADAKSEFTLTVDNDKVQVDRQAATEKVADLGVQAKDTVAGPGGKNEDSTKVNHDSDKTAVTENVDDLGNRAVAASGENRHDGTVVSVGDELKMMDNEGNEHRHAVAANVTVTCDGKTCNAADLKPGMKIRVTTDSATPHMVTRIEALAQRDAFETG